MTILVSYTDMFLSVCYSTSNSVQGHHDTRPFICISLFI